jgi:hypothetical protein
MRKAPIQNEALYNSFMLLGQVTEVAMVFISFKSQHIFQRIIFHPKLFCFIRNYK